MTTHNYKVRPMADAIKETDAEQEVADVVRSQRWTADEWRRIGKAAERLGEREHLNLSHADIIKSGALRRADEINDAA